MSIFFQITKGVLSMRTIFTAIISGMCFVVSGCATNAFADSEAPKCHMYLKSGGYVVNVKDYISTAYSSSQLCETTLKSYVCYSYYHESRTTCKKSNSDLVDQFLKEARDAGQIN